MESSPTPNQTNPQAMEAFKKDLAGDFDSSITGYGYFFFVEKADKALLEKVKLFLSKFPEALNYIFEVRPPAANGRFGSLLLHAIYIKKPLTVQYLLSHKNIDLSIKFVDNDPVKWMLGQSANGCNAMGMANKYQFEDIKEAIKYAKVVRKSVWSWRREEVKTWASKHIGGSSALLKDVNGERLLESEDLLQFNLTLEEQSLLLKQLDLITPLNTERDRFRTIEAPKEDLGPNFVKVILSGPATKTCIQTLKDYLCLTHKPVTCTDKVVKSYEKVLTEQLANNSKNLPPESCAVVYVYTLDCGFYEHVNVAFRNDVEKELEQLVGYVQKLMKCWEVAAPELYFSGVVSRRMKLEKATVEKDYFVGKVFTWRSCISTTMKGNPSEQFGEVIFRVKIPEEFKYCALQIWKYSRFPLEKEVLLKPNLWYKVVSVDMVALVIEMEVCEKK